MIGATRRHIGGEQLLPLWTWLLEGYLPVAHIVADLDELEAPASNESAELPSGHVRHAGPPAHTHEGGMTGITCSYAARAA
jgi:hypothetical protein